MVKLHVIVDLPEVQDSEITEYMGGLNYLWQDDQISTLDDLAYTLDKCTTKILSIEEVERFCFGEDPEFCPCCGSPKLIHQDLIASRRILVCDVCNHNIEVL